MGLDVFTMSYRVRSHRISAAVGESRPLRRSHDTAPVPCRQLATTVTVPHALTCIRHGSRAIDTCYRCDSDTGCTIVTRTRLLARQVARPNVDACTGAFL